jgi:hypothetical protein
VKKSPHKTSQRALSPALPNNLLAPSATCGRSKRMPLVRGLLLRIFERKRPWPPPTSTILAKREKSYARVTASAATPVKLVIASLKIVPSSRFASSHSKWGTPYTL